MSVPRWPAELPQAIPLAGLQEGTGDGRTQSQGRPGRKPRSRLETGVPTRPVSGSIVISAAQRGLLQSFVDEDLAGGTAWFEFPDPFFHGLQITDGYGGPVLVDEMGRALTITAYPLAFFQTLPSYTSLASRLYRADLSLLLVD